MDNLMNFYKDRNVFITGHTGFKGSWMVKLLKMAGANVTGYSLPAPTKPSLYEIAEIEKGMVSSIIGDIRDLEHLKTALKQSNPEIVIHMAAQPIVIASYNDPVYTYATNVMGTVNILEAVRTCKSVKSFINVTTDKVYKNNEWCYGYRENDVLDGYDPYSNSKSCSELVTNSFKLSFFYERDIAVSTCRAGNVIGGGDFSPDRIIPDCIRAASKKERIIVRNPYSTRPYQHVLEPVYTYLELAMLQYNNINLAGAYNIGPDEEDCVTTGRLVDIFCKYWGGAEWQEVNNLNAPHEANFLKLDCSKIKNTINYHIVWHIEEAVKAAVDWSKAYLSGEDVNNIMHKQIEEFTSLKNNIITEAVV